jgi:hypothetical protein
VSELCIIIEHAAVQLLVGLRHRIIVWIGLMLFIQHGSNPAAAASTFGVYTKDTYT